MVQRHGRCYSLALQTQLAWASSERLLLHTVGVPPLAEGVLDDITPDDALVGGSDVQHARIARIFECKRSDPKPHAVDCELSVNDFYVGCACPCKVRTLVGGARSSRGNVLQ